jgi:short-subunit dehydrogenase
VAEDQEVWFGFTFNGWSAKLAAFPHWFVYAAAAYGFRRRRQWVCSWGAAYTAQIAFGMLVWSVLEFGSFLGWLMGLIAALPFAALAVVLWNSRDHFFAKLPPLRDRYGDWALVTGASSGIGAEFARALAREGVSLVLTARREDRLRNLAGELEKRHNVATRIVALDLAEPDGPDRLAGALQDIEIGILVNNAGVGYVGRFDKQDTARLRGLVQVNCVAPVVLTSRILPGMRDRGRGAVIFTGSAAGRQPVPLHAVYSATKAFDQLLGEALWVEARNSGVDVLVLEPGTTETEFQQVAGEIAHRGQSAQQVVQVAIDALGQQPSVISGWSNWIRANLGMRLGSRPLVAYIARHVMTRQAPSEMR